MEYGYLWWIISRKKNIYAAIGNSGNVIYINPQKQLVIAVASYFKPTIFDRVDFIQKYIEPFTETAEKSWWQLAVSKIGRILAEGYLQKGILPLSAKIILDIVRKIIGEKYAISKS